MNLYDYEKLHNIEGLALLITVKRDIVQRPNGHTQHNVEYI